MFIRNGLPIFICVLFFAVSASGGEEPSLANLKPAHPRILADEARESELRELQKTDEYLRNMLARVVSDADKLLETPDVTEYKIVGPRLLSQSRKCLARVLTLGTAYRFTDDPAKKEVYKNRVMREIRSVASFPDWNPSHYLDTAEMTAACAVAYDWFFDALTAEEKTLFVDTIYEKGLTPSFAVYRKGGWWTKSEYNWNQVCNGGMTLGALAIGDALDGERREMAEYVIRNAVASVPTAMKTFAPDGAWGEGTAYWSYTTRYTIFLITSLEASLGTDFGISAAPGFHLCGNSQIALADPTGISFNYADAGTGSVTEAQLFWLANRFHQPGWAAANRHFNVRPSAEAVWYYTPQTSELESLPKDFYFRGTEIATMRSSWSDPDAWFVGFKAGSNAVNHSHLDLGSFVLVRNQTRWAIDPGADNYNLPGYFGSLRWTYYRLGTQGHNTLLFDLQNQNPNGFAPVTKFESDPAFCTATADLTGAYSKCFEKIQRTITLDRERGRVTVSDEIGPVIVNEKPEIREILWQFHTFSAPEIAPDGKSAVLRQGQKTLNVRITQSTHPDARFEVRSTAQTEAENPNRGISRLVIVLPGAADAPQTQTLSVEFSD